MRQKVSILIALLVGMMGSGVVHADDALLKRFSCGLTGHWDNVRQARRDAAADLDDANRHPRRAMTYVPVAGGNSPEIFDKVERVVDSGSVTARMLAISSDLRCPETHEVEP
jgi:uncharacterized protein YbjT (DUF2867 family)